MRVALVSLPFDALNRPHLALSLLRSVLNQNGIACDLHYLNTEFANFVGVDAYDFVAEGSPTSALLGDAVFSSMSRGGNIDWASYLRSADFECSDRYTNKALRRFLAELELDSQEWIRTVASLDHWGVYDLIGVSATFNLLPSLAFTGEIKRRHQKVKVILGGSQCDDDLGNALFSSFPYLDFICRGDGEEAIVEVARHFQGSGRLDKVPGLCWRSDDGAAVINSGRGVVKDLDSLPSPAFDDWLLLYSANPAFSKRTAAFPLETSRGCWWGQKSHCTFCGLNGIGMESREKSPQRAIDDIASLTNLGAQRIDAVDNILPYSYFKTVLPALAKTRRHPRLFYEVKSNLSEGNCRLLKEAGVDIIQPGIESLSTATLKLMHKGTTALQNVRLLRVAAELGINVTWNLLYGFPREDPLEYQKQESLIPLLHHLQAPTHTGTRIRLDRFSPLFFNAAALGVNSLRPLPVYSHLLSLDDASLFRVASFFQFSGEYFGDPEDYTKGLRTALQQWHKAMGNETLIAIDRNSELSICDTRSIAVKREYVLHGQLGQVLKQCRDGASLHSLAVELGAPPATIECLMNQLLSLRLVVELDSRYLSLPIFFPEVAVESIPKELQTALLVNSINDSMRRQRRQVEEHEATVTMPLRNRGGSVK